MGDEDVYDEVVQEEAVTKDVAGESDNPNAQHTHHQSETSREKLTMLVRS